MVVDGPRSVVVEPESGLSAVCDVCNRIVAPSKGTLWVDDREIEAVRGGVTAWETNHPSDELASAGDLAKRPSPARWRVTHTACDPGAPGDIYAIELKRIQSFRDLAGWTTHLMGTSWLQYTDWDALVTGALGGGKRRLRSKHKDPWMA
ncbi:hypothetical protein [Actinoplanes sp. NPDC051851]|uniref:hypothetical protein n=1 Tax=Actinoplanes sp. NPDC051851 TaxID=3154753 RepID=UPI003426235C